MTEAKRLAIKSLEHLAWGFGFMFAVYLSANISGAHLNPAISLMFWIQGDMGFIRMLVYWVAQYFGAIIGSLVSFAGHYGKRSDQ